MNNFVFALLNGFFFSLNVGLGTFHALEGRSGNAAFHLGAAGFIGLFCLLLAIAMIGDR